jgi:hypothetical protein
LIPFIRGYNNGKLLSCGYRVPLWDGEKVPEMDSGDICTRM